MNGVKKGCSSDNLKEYKLKKSLKDKTKVSDLVRVNHKKGLTFNNHKINFKCLQEDIAFVIIYDNSSKTLDLLAPNEVERDRWVRVLDYFIILCKKRKGVLPETDEYVMIKC